MFEPDNAAARQIRLLKLLKTSGLILRQTAGLNCSRMFVQKPRVIQNSVSVFMSLPRKFRGQHINFCSQVVHKWQIASKTALPRPFLKTRAGPMPLANEDASGSFF
jgi:hypothetical protein